MVWHILVANYLKTNDKFEDCHLKNKMIEFRAAQSCYKTYSLGKFAFTDSLTSKCLCSSFLYITHFLFILFWNVSGHNLVIPCLNLKHLQWSFSILMFTTEKIKKENFFFENSNYSCRPHQSNRTSKKREWLSVVQL